MKSTQSATDVTDNLNLDVLTSLAPAQRGVLAVLMARVAERSYRRGVQQGATMAATPGRLREGLHDWRYGSSTDASPWADDVNVEPSLSRLLSENSGLRQMLPAKARGVGTGAHGDFVERLVELAKASAATRDGSATGEQRLVAHTNLRAYAIELQTLLGTSRTLDIHADASEQLGDDASSLAGFAKWLDA